MTRILIICSVLVFATSCTKFLDAKLNRSLTPEDKIFSNDITATSAMVGIYVDIQNGSPLGGSGSSLLGTSGLSAKEMTSYDMYPDYLQFEAYAIQTNNSTVKYEWDFLYRIIYQANAILSGLESSASVTSATAQQLKGEALFVRAYCYFHLVNFFGDVPVVLTTDYHQTAKQSRLPVSKVYEQIRSDLEAAQGLLKDEYVSAERARPNKATVDALLSRVYLYQGEWADAETMASSLIGNSSYRLEDSVADVFLKGSSETIFQLMPVSIYSGTPQAVGFVLLGTPYSATILTTGMLNAFESGDKRKASWVGSLTNDDGTFYFMHKYKQRDKLPNDEWTEYSVIFRLAEQYLIRAEARARLDDLAGAKADIDSIRHRAGLGNTTASGKDALLLAIEQERRIEFFVEGCHRWLDLKRTGRALTILGGGITQEDLLYPVPRDEFIRNPDMGEQNPGYN